MEFEYTTKGMVMVVNEGGERRDLREASSWCVLKNSFYNTRCVYFTILFTHHCSFSPSSFACCLYFVNEATINSIQILSCPPHVPASRIKFLKKKQCRSWTGSDTTKFGQLVRFRTLWI